MSPVRFAFLLVISVFIGEFMSAARLHVNDEKNNV